ncbi:hypothetical protein RV11_GL001083 [Enterococcus phoeniculicola]|jgi:uncharacterized membrane protein YgaE (UPF0421/DUF939 family)|uniref:Putative aromatic acid exporter C-terminal domain-containing protein n=1 Tax=Enterococcus phoeniculicola ATCC BAA-412 TaxID=1158610 RepID=R3W7X0_9ENTE|nr:aromatic acid exporter family protein [Enterococcus phoeniculicola]EOL43901.1 hypothetical protein UC3_01882 [Enterococcus phoeniculicola ATCC BAA-412]EOT76735.1 hypothetical protein I589_01693 [Enterococcus phoeniculicola ATCC BAA-412]OJG70544.1 hypothetical protein RV11_GL001083 [Enterococcus phoeniculicola]
MRIGLRTVKTGVSAALAMILANALQLLYAPSAGIIAVLSVTNSKKSSLQTGIYRLFSLTLATLISYICFSLLGYQPIAFGIFLLLFIPIAVSLGLSDGIVVSSVLVTHYLVEESMSWGIIFNEYLLMTIGVGFALIANLYMPNAENRLKEDQQIIETMFKKLLTEMSSYLKQEITEQKLLENCNGLLSFIRQGQLRAQTYQENQWVVRDVYYASYFAMRRSQVSVLHDMIESLDRIEVVEIQVEKIVALLEYTSETFAEENDGNEILARIFDVYEEYRQMTLPISREEFENRAELFQFLQSFKSFIEIKAEFSQRITE